MTSFRSLVENYERTKKDLVDAEKTIRRLTGRDPDDVMASVTGSGKRLSSSAAVPSRPSFLNRRKPNSLPRKRSRERESSYEEESSTDDESPSKKPTLQSTVVAKKHQKRSRKATIEEQNANSAIKSRNRRMLKSLLVKTLTDFQKDQKKNADRENKRAEIEQKVEAATEEEKERIKREKEHLFVTRREKQTQLRCLEKKIERAESHEVFDSNHRHLLNYIMTKSKPPIFFLPSSHTPETRKALEESRAKMQEIIKKRKDNFEKDLADIDEWYKKDSSLSSDKKDKCLKDETSSHDGPEIKIESLVVEQKDIIKKRKESFENDLLEIEDWYKKDSSMPSDKENKCPKDETESHDVPEMKTDNSVTEQENTGQDLNSNHNSNSSSKSSSSDSDMDIDEDSNNPKNVGSLGDQDFEPIYD